jgi:capsular polysaccharide biosynthesis protein
VNPPNPQAPAPDEPGQIVNFRAVFNWVRFIGQAGVRRKKIVFFITATMVGLALVALQFIPRKYDVNCKVLAKRSEILSTRSDGQNAADPTRTAADMILSTENLASLVDQTDLVRQRKERRTPAQKLKDSIFGLWSTPASDADMKKGMVEYLRSRLQVWSSDGTITIAVTWPDGDLAYRLVDAAQRSFLESRHVQEVTTFGEQVAILEGHAATLVRDVDAAVQKVQVLREKKKNELEGPSKKDSKDSKEAKSERRTASSEPRANAAAPAAPAPSPERDRRLAELPALIEAKQRLVDDLDGERRRRLVDLEAKLEKQRGVLTDAHPEVADVKEAIAVASTPSPQAARVRDEIDALKAEQSRLLGDNTPSAPGGAPSGSGAPRRASVSEYHPPRPRPQAYGEAARREQEDDPEIEFARSELDFAIAKYQGVQDAVRATRLELETAQAAFKYRYKIITPPERPRGPTSPKPLLILIGALIAGLGVGWVAAFGLEAREGMLRQSWHVEHLLDIPVLGEIQLPKSTGSR